MRRIVVIGGLAAGPAAAARAAREDPAAEVTLVEAGPHLAYGVCELPHLLAGEVTRAEDLTPWSPARFEREKRVRVRTGQRARAVDAGARRVWLDDERGREVELGWDALVLATGATPRRPRAGPARPLKTLADATLLRQLATATAGGAAAVLGAGYIGLLAASALARCGLGVTLFEREPLPLAGFEEEARQLVLARLAALGVEFRGGVEVTTGTVDGADLVVSALGSDPATELAQAAGIELGASGAIRTDERGETSVRGVFAAGDCAEVKDAVSGRPRRVALATVANRAGRVAGANAAGGHQRLGAVVGALVFRALGLEAGCAGLSAAAAAAAGFEPRVTSVVSPSRAPLVPGARPILVTLIADRPSGRLLGANLIGEEGAALRLNTLAPLLARGVTVAELAAVELGYAPDLSPLTDPLLAAARRAERERRS